MLTDKSSKGSGSYRKVQPQQVAMHSAVSLGDTNNSAALAGSQGAVTGKATSVLLREAARQEALKFMPAVSQILATPSVSISVKLRLFETLLLYGVGQKVIESKSAISVQNAVIALQPRRDAKDLLPIANPSQTVSGVPIALALPAKGISGSE